MLSDKIFRKVFNAICLLFSRHDVFSHQNIKVTSSLLDHDEVSIKDIQKLFCKTNLDHQCVKSIISSDSIKGQQVTLIS